MFKVFITTVLLLISGCSSTYLNVGAGYKFDEPHIRWDDGSQGSHPVSARIELYQENNHWRYGISHHSQWFDTGMEPGKTEVFLDYKILLVK